MLSRQFLDNVGKGLLQSMEQQKAEEEARKVAQANWARQMQLKQFADERAAADRASREAIAKARDAASEAHWNEQAKRDLAQHAERMAALKRQRETANKRWNITQNQRANKTKIGALEKQLLGYGKDISDALFNDRPEIAASLTPLYNKIAAQLRELGYPAEDYGGRFLQPKQQEVPGLPGAQPMPDPYTEGFLKRGNDGQLYERTGAGWKPYLGNKDNQLHHVINPFAPRQKAPAEVYPTKRVPTEKDKKRQALLMAQKALEDRAREVEKAKNQYYYGAQ